MQTPLELFGGTPHGPPSDQSHLIVTLSRAFPIQSMTFVAGSKV